MAETPFFKWPLPDGTDSVDVVADMLSLATAIEEDFKTAGAGDAKKLLIVQNTGLPAWKAMSGDATISEAGALTIGNEKITQAKIALLAITEALISGEAVGTGKIANLAVTAAKLAAECVETAKIANLAVTEAKLAALSVSTAKLAKEAVTAEKLAPEAVEWAKMAKAVRRRIPLFGVVTAAGAKAGGSEGWTCKKNSTGYYRVTYAEKYAANAAPMVVFDTNENIGRSINVANVGLEYFEVQTYNNAKALADYQFWFQVCGD